MDAKPRNDAPHGMEPYDLGGSSDLGALSREQQTKLNSFKIQARIENELYLRQHPEINCLLTTFVSEVLHSRPQHIREFAAEFFTDADLPSKLDKLMDERQQLMRMNNIIKQL